MEALVTFLIALAVLFGLAGTWFFAMIEIDARRAGMRPKFKVFRSVVYQVEVIRFYKQAAIANGWPTWYVTAHWICVVGMFAAAILAFVLFEYSRAAGN